MADGDFSKIAIRRQALRGFKGCVTTVNSSTAINRPHVDRSAARCKHAHTATKNAVPEALDACFRVAYSLDNLPYHQDVLCLKVMQPGLDKDYRRARQNFTAWPG